MCHFWVFFGLFSKNRIEILSLNCQNVDEIDFERTQKTAGLILFKKLRYLGQKPFMDGPKSKKSSNFAYKNPSVGPNHLKMIYEVSSVLLLNKSIKPNALSLVKVLIYRAERGTILHFSGALNPKRQIARLGCHKKLEELTLTIFLKLCMHLDIDQQSEVTRPDF